MCDTFNKVTKLLKGERMSTDVAWTLFMPDELVVMNTNSSMPSQVMKVKDC